MSSTDKQGDVAVQKKDDVKKEGCVTEKENDLKSDSSPQKRSASELNSADESRKRMKTHDDINEKENGESEEKYDEDGEDDDDVVPDDYDEGEDGEGDEEGAEDEEDEEEEA